MHNHLHAVHATASCNAAEIAMGMLMEATVPVSIVDRSGAEVVHADITTWVTPAI